TKEYIEEQPGLDYVVELVGTKDFDFEQKFVALLKAEFTSDLGEYLYHIRIDEPRAAAEIVHRIKYKLSVLGMERAFAFAEMHKERLHLGDKSFDSDFKGILKTISNFLETV
ncbi:MAG: Hpt domain-containing protein, partial [Pricia sp.]|nr:Hpt domain-containing protein [Pricia sp.]